MRPLKQAGRPYETTGVYGGLLEAAYAEPRLWQLFPWSGMGEFHFSRCIERRWTWDIPYLQPAGGAYWVAGPL
ncbi:DUF6193 family natural product biosynthesis protein [Streptomyces sp. PU_AKi4]|uniref:DUF6193 family natural product biosynthesis protein n=1 Tax=Streptomyces sp. PU_AKi4 TaxID=2800809 RepID=UPI0035251783